MAERVDLAPRFAADRDARFAGGAPATLAAVAGDAAQPAALQGADAFRCFAGSGGWAPLWANEVTLRSVEAAMEYEPGTAIARIAPTPLLMIVATEDHVTPTDLALEAFVRAGEPKRLVTVEGGHFSVYSGVHFHTASQAAAEWLREHLAARGDAGQAGAPP